MKPEPKYYCVMVDGKLATNCQKDPLVYFKRRDAIEMSRREHAWHQGRKDFKVVRVTINIETK